MFEISLPRLDIFSANCIPLRNLRPRGRQEQDGAPPSGLVADLTLRSALLAGVAIGAAAAVALPALVHHLRGAAAEKGTGAADKGENGTHAVRAGASVRIPREELTEVVAACLQAAGATAAHARASAEVLVFADCRGIPSHGVNRADFYAAELEEKLVDGAAEPVVAVDSGCCALVDGRNALGAVVSRCAMDLAISKARARTVSAGSCARAATTGAAGYWAEQAARQHPLAFSFTNTAPFMVTHGRPHTGGEPARCLG